MCPVCSEGIQIPELEVESSRGKASRHSFAPKRSRPLMPGRKTRNTSRPVHYIGETTSSPSRWIWAVVGGGAIAPIALVVALAMAPQDERTSVSNSRYAVAAAPSPSSPQQQRQLASAGMDDHRPPTESKQVTESDSQIENAPTLPQASSQHDKPTSDAPSSDVESVLGQGGRYWSSVDKIDLTWVLEGAVDESGKATARGNLIFRNGKTLFSMTLRRGAANTATVPLAKGNRFGLWPINARDPEVEWDNFLGGKQRTLGLDVHWQRTLSQSDSPDCFIYHAVCVKESHAEFLVLAAGSQKIELATGIATGKRSVHLLLPEGPKNFTVVVFAAQDDRELIIPIPMSNIVVLEMGE